ncbi:MAG: metal ABC transporter ATP-binding protein [Planctomycetota bacterium]
MPASSGSSEVAIEVDGVTVRYPGAVEPAVRSLSLRVNAGERLGVLGPNGGGKSTLLGVILGGVRPSEGRVRVFGHEPGRALALGLVGHVPQRPSLERGFPLTARQVVRQAVSISLPAWRSFGRDAASRVDEMLGLVDSTAYADELVGSLSGGQLQRVLIARAVAPGPRVLLLDEPTTGVDVSGQRRFAEMIDTLVSTLGLTVVTVSHEVRTLAATSDRVACLSRTLHYHDAPHGLTREVLAELFQHDVEAVLDGGVTAHPHAPGEAGVHERGGAAS